MQIRYQLQSSVIRRSNYNMMNSILNIKELVEITKTQTSSKPLNLLNSLYFETMVLSFYISDLQDREMID